MLNKMLAVCPQEQSRLQDRCLCNMNCAEIGDDLDLPLVELCRTLRTKGVECHTFDVRPLECFDGFLFLEMPSKDNGVLMFAQSRRLPVFVIVAENHFICTRNADFDRYSEFAAVFTYNDEAVARNIAVKLNYALGMNLPPENGVAFADRKLAVMISSRVKKNRPHLCSYLRLRTIQYYERHHKCDFDLFGPGWKKGIYWKQEDPRLYAWLSCMRLNKILPKQHLSNCWRGVVDRKRDVIGRYRFAYCYENTTEIPGYITEKIFDVMMSGAVPIYLGHSSTSNRIPKECYIDRADFRDDAELYDYISKMPEEEWRGYLEAAHNFLLSKKAVPFSVPHYVKTVTDVMLPKLGISQADNLQQGD